MAEVILPAVAASAAAGSTTAALTLAAVNFGISAVASYAANALTPKPKIPGTGGFLVNEVNPTAPAEYVYGEVRKGGVVTYDEATDDNAILHRIIVLAAGEHEVGDIYLNDEVVEISGNDFSLTDPGDASDVYTGAGWVTTEKWMEDNQIREPRVRIFVHDGSQTSAADTFANSSSRSLANELIAKSANGLDASFVGRGLTYLYVQMNIDNEVFAGGVPRITAMVKRKGVYDPRDDTNKITSNWALCVADYLQADYGLGDAGSVDSTALSAEANICEEAVALDAGGTQARYEANGVFRADEEPGQILSRLMPSGSGSLFWGQGKWNIRAGAYAGAVASFGLSDLRSGIEVETRTPRAQNYNAIRGVFNDKSQRYIEGEYPRISSATFLAVDGGFENVLDYDLPFETDGVRAQRLAKLALYRQREQIRVEADFNMRAASVQPGDVIDLTIDLYGWDAKAFEVVGWQLKISETGTLCVRLSLKETSEAAFDWNAEESVFEGNNTNLPDRFTVPTVTLGTPIIGRIAVPGGADLTLVTVPWVVTSPGLVSDYVFQWRENDIDYDANGGFVELSSPTAREQAVYDAYLKGLRRVPDQNGFDFYVSGGGSGLSADEVLAQITNSVEGQNQDTFQSVVTRETRHELRTLKYGQRYDFRVYARNARGVRSAADATTYLIEGDSIAPNPPTTLSAVGGFETVTLGWTAPTTNTDSTPLTDLAGYNIYRSLTNSFGSADLVGTTPSKSYADTGLADNTVFYYWVTAFDHSGNESAASVGDSATTNFISAAQMVADIRDEIQAVNIRVLPALTDGSEASVGDGILLTTDQKLYTWDGTFWTPAVGEIPADTIVATQITDNAVTSPKIISNAITSDKINANAVTSDKIIANAITAGKISTGAVSADKIAVTTLAAINANLGTVTAGSINTVSSGVGVQVNISARPAAVYSFQDSETIYSFYAQNDHLPPGTTGEGGAGYFQSISGYGIEIRQSGDYTGEQAAMFAQNAQDVGSGPRGGAVYLGRGFTEGNYGVEVLRGGYYDTSGDGYIPFTGAHEAIISKGAKPKPGDILCDVRAIVTGLSDSITEVSVSSEPNQPTAVGVFKNYKESWGSVAAFVDRAKTAKEMAKPVLTKSGKRSKAKRQKKYKTDPSQFQDDFNLLVMNSLGEGGVNVCGENGDIKPGDLIVTSSTPGKGMKQDDDVIRNYTVAKAREAATFKNKRQSKMIACIYLCG